MSTEPEKRSDEETKYEPPTFCTAAVEVEIDGETQDYSCTQRFGHPEAHSCRMYWTNETEVGGVDR